MHLGGLAPDHDAEASHSEKADIMTTTPSVADFLNGAGGGKSLKFPEVGTVGEGTIISADVRQARDIDGNAKTWENGDPVNELQIKVQTEQRDDDEDDGVRTWYCSGGKGEADDGKGLSAIEAVKAALADAKLKEIPLGGTIKVRFSGTRKPSKRGFNPAKRYQVKFGAAPESTVAAEDF